MADTKVTAMPPATSVATNDVLYLVKPSTSPYDHKVSIANLFAGIPVPVKLDNTLTLGGTPQNITSVGTPVSVSTLVTKIHNPQNNGTCTIPNGVNGQIKVIIMTGNPGSYNVLVDNIAGGVLSFRNVGDTATLMFMDGDWFKIGGTATFD